MKNLQEESLLVGQVVELLKGGFAPNVILLREFDHQKAGIILEGLHFSAWILLGHICARQKTLLEFIQEPKTHSILWKDAHWPDNYEPKSRKEWDDAIDAYAKDLKKFIKIIEDPETKLFEIQKNGESIFGAAMILQHHTGYHIGQLKAVGRQLGVW